jgi:hypothetical protein
VQPPVRQAAHPQEHQRVDRDQQQGDRGARGARSGVDERKHAEPSSPDLVGPARDRVDPWRPEIMTPLLQI